MVLVSDHPRREAVAEEMARSLVAPIETLCVEEVQAVEGSRNPCETTVHYDVVMRVHQAEHQTSELEATERFAELSEERASIVVVVDDQAGVDAARDEVEEPLIR